MAGPSSEGEGTTIASTGSVEIDIDGPRSRVSKETGSVLEDIPGTGGKETTAETTVHSTQRTPQEILKDFAEDWLETLDTKMKSNPYPYFYVITLCIHFPLLKLKLQGVRHPW